MSGTESATLNTGDYRVYDGGNAWELVASNENVRVETIRDGRTIRKDDLAGVGSYDRYSQFFGADVRAFDAVKVTALTDATTFTLSVSDGQSGKNQTVSSIQEITEPVKLAVSGSPVAIADLPILAAATATVPANANRSGIVVFADVDLKWGTGAGAAAGARIPAGTIGTIPGNGAVVFFNVNATTAGVIEVTEVV